MFLLFCHGPQKVDLLFMGPWSTEFNLRLAALRAASGRILGAVISAASPAARKASVRLGEREPTSASRPDFEPCLSKGFVLAEDGNQSG